MRLNVRIMPKTRQFRGSPIRVGGGCVKGLSKAPPIPTLNVAPLRFSVGVDRRPDRR